jgi:hypothetical protein
MPPKLRTFGKKKGPTKEELERMQREAEEKRVRDELFAREREHEAFQQRHDAERDAHDSGASARQLRERELRELHDQRVAFEALALKMARQTDETTTERADTERELSQLRAALERARNDLAKTSRDALEADRTLRDCHDRVVAENIAQDVQLTKARARIEALVKDVATVERVATKEVDALKAELLQLRERYHRDVGERDFKLRHAAREVAAAREVQQSTADMLAARESDVQRMQQLLQLTNQQLEEATRRQADLLDDERRRNREVTAEALLLRAEVASLQEAQRVAHAELAAAQRDTGAAARDLQQSAARVDEWRATMRSEFESIKAGLAADLAEASARTAAATAAAAAAETRLVSSAQAVAALEDLLRTRERRRAEQTAFLNAQIASERAIVRELLDERAALEAQHAARVAELTQIALQQRAGASDMSQALLRQMEAAAAERAQEQRIRQANDAHFRGRITDHESELKRPGALRVAEANSESELDVALREITRLEQVLAENHIVYHKGKSALDGHRGASTRIGDNKNDNADNAAASFSASASSSPIAAASGGGGSQRPSSRPQVAAAGASTRGDDGKESTHESADELRRENRSLQVKLERALADQEVQRRIGAEVEARLDAQVKNLYQVIDALHNELDATRRADLERVYALEKDNERLRAAALEQQASSQQQQQQASSSPTASHAKPPKAPTSGAPRPSSGNAPITRPPPNPSVTQRPPSSDSNGSEFEL